jgi:hypothetical protein
MTNEEDSKDYFGQECLEAEINRKFRDLHLKIVNEVISFCKGNNIIVDELFLRADSLSESIKFGSWHPATDSQFELVKDVEGDDYKQTFLFPA